MDSDGLVPYLDGIIPGSDLVHVHGVDHGSSVMVIGKQKEDSIPEEGEEKEFRDAPADLTQALIIMALKMPKK